MDVDLVQNAVASTGVSVLSPHIADSDTSKVRIRKFRPVIDAAFRELDDTRKGHFAQIVAEVLLKALGHGDLRTGLEEGLNRINWTIADGTLKTQDATLSEQFFPPGTPFDAYVAIRSILQQATTQVCIVDSYIGSNVFVTLAAALCHDVVVRVLTTKRGLKPDVELEAQKYRQQFPKGAVEIRTSEDFHDRFIVVDEKDFYHVGASIKDAGTRAFLASKLEDQPVVDLLRQYIRMAWESASPVA